MVYYADEEHPRKRLKLWDKSEAKLVAGSMEEFNSETDSDYTSYWRDWVGWHRYSLFRGALSLYYVSCPGFFSAKAPTDRCGFCWTALYRVVVNAYSNLGF